MGRAGGAAPGDHRGAKAAPPARAIARTALCVLLAATGCALVRGRDDVSAALRARRLMVPVAGMAPADVRDTFDDPRDGGAPRHAALDIPAVRGTAVLSADDGTVVAIRDGVFGGRTIYATDPDRRFVYYYAHLAERRRDLRPGTPVARGEQLGTVGTSGNADHTYPHLHFQVTVRPEDGRWWAGRPLDPRPFFAAAGTPR
jgi:murein DD-endopeptidase MepM/ murein hydrolase activator NlpD